MTHHVHSDHKKLCSRHFTRSMMCLGLMMIGIACAKKTPANQPHVAPPVSDADKLYRQGLAELDDDMYPEALQIFNEVKTKYPYSEFAVLADLRIADVNFKNDKFLEAIDGYRNFIRYHPAHAEAPYALFQVAESQWEQVPRDWWFLPPTMEKEQTNNHLAVDAFREFLARYPEHPLAAKAQERLNACLRKLANHEMYVAQFYFKRKKWPAARGRAEHVLRHYPGVGWDATAMWIIAESHLKQKDQASAITMLQQLSDRYGDTNEGKKATHLLKTLPPAEAPVDEAGSETHEHAGEVGPEHADEIKDENADPEVTAPK